MVIIKLDRLKMCYGYDMAADEFKPNEIEAGVNKVNFFCISVLHFSISFCKDNHLMAISNMCNMHLNVVFVIHISDSHLLTH